MAVNRYPNDFDRVVREVRRPDGIVEFEIRPGESANAALARKMAVMEQARRAPPPFAAHPPPLTDVIDLVYCNGVWSVP